MNGRVELRRLAAAAVLCALGALLLPFEALRLIFAAPLALLLPGYAIAAASFPPGRLDWTRFLLVSLVLSICTLALGGLVLNYMPGGIRPLSWALLLVLVTTLGCRRASRRRPGPKAAAPALRRPRLGLYGGGLVLAGLAAMVAALALSQTTLPADEAVGFTELWVLPEGSDPSREVQVGVGSEEQTKVFYDLLIEVGDRPLVRRSFSLAPGHTRLVRLRTAPSPDGRPIPVTASLLRQNHFDEIYRRVRSWLPPPGASR
jgi:hypothetical protein